MCAQQPVKSLLYELTLTRPKKCSLAGNMSDPMSFSSWDALPPLRTKSNISVEAWPGLARRRGKGTRGGVCERPWIYYQITIKCQM